MTNPSVLQKINEVEASFGFAPPILVPSCLAESIKEILDAVGQQPERFGQLAGRAQGCGIFLGECMKAQQQ